MVLMHSQRLFVFKLLGPTLVPFLHGLFVFQASIRELYEKVCAMTGVPQEKVCFSRCFISISSFC